MERFTATLLLVIAVYNVDGLMQESEKLALNNYHLALLSLSKDDCRS